MLEKNQLKNYRIDNRGITLIELIVSLAISSFVILGAYSLVMLGSRNYQRTNTVTNVQQEMSFASNIVGEAIRSGDSSTAIIWKVPDGSGNTDVVLYLGYDASAVSSDIQKKVFHFDASEKLLYIYESEGDVTDSADLLVYINKPDDVKKDHIVSKYVTEFDAFSVSGRDDIEPAAADYQSMLKITDWSKLIEVTMTVQIKDRQDKSDINYQIRN